MIIEQKLNVPFEFPVIFTDDVFSPENLTLANALDRLREAGRRRAAVYVDENVAASRPDITSEIANYFERHNRVLDLAGPPQLTPGGEVAKNDFALAEKWAAQMLDLHLDRHSFVVIVGGGAVLDAVGFAASLVHRGLRIVRVPTTVLAQNDGGVGVKTGVNFRGGKNALGTFAPPFAVINDFQFLRTLDDREWRAGIAEAFKVAMIRDREFFEFLCANAAKLRGREEPAMRHLVRRCAELHLEHIRTGGDPFEMGRARPLDFGHWSAHKLELMSGFAISHGDAVAAGILLDSTYAARHGWLSESDRAALYASLGAAGFPLWREELDREEIFDGLREFQEHLGGELCITFPDGIGARRESHEIDLHAMREAIAELKRHDLSPPV
ncbi:MAG: hypothetical protein QOD99_2536 [Chthoniobacter sp.]|jgi:3-dehydroquinate synthase|nr:hypothetical protein [Chthoniobacter sp.]